jgi:hypothetical protein
VYSATILWQVIAVGLLIKIDQNWKYHLYWRQTDCQLIDVRTALEKVLIFIRIREILFFKRVSDSRITCIFEEKYVIILLCILR